MDSEKEQKESLDYAIARDKLGSIIFLTDGCQVTHPSVRFFV